MTAKVTYDVEVLDQVNEGLEVWASGDDHFQSPLLAESLALELSSRGLLHHTRVVKITREVVSRFAFGEQIAILERKE